MGASVASGTMQHALGYLLPGEALEEGAGPEALGGLGEGVGPGRVEEGQGGPGLAPGIGGCGSCEHEQALGLVEGKRRGCFIRRGVVVDEGQPGWLQRFQPEEVALAIPADLTFEGAADPKVQGVLPTLVSEVQRRACRALQGTGVVNRDVSARARAVYLNPRLAGYRAGIDQAQRPRHSREMEARAAHAQDMAAILKVPHIGQPNARAPGLDMAPVGQGGLTGGQAADAQAIGILSHSLNAAVGADGVQGRARAGADAMRATPFRRDAAVQGQGVVVADPDAMGIRIGGGDRATVSQGVAVWHPDPHGIGAARGDVASIADLVVVAPTIQVYFQTGLDAIRLPAISGDGLAVALLVVDAGANAVGLHTLGLF